MPQQATTINLFMREQVAYLTLDNEAKHNALGQYELDQLEVHLQAIAQQQDLRALVLTGAGSKTFCAGAALDQLDREHFNGDNFAKVTAALAGLELPTVCALNGNVFGAGVDLAIACDFRIGLRGTRMRVPAAAIGACYPPASIQRLVVELGTGAARRLLLLAETFDAQAMHGCGFLHWLVTAEELQSRVDEIIATISSLAPRSISAMKQIIRQASEGRGDPQFAEELMHACFACQDFSEGLAAQKEKRPPVFSGR
ncbi:MAG: enoyl-CoA hydratase/isomerase family protein [Gammaproteobacteria bacterium]|nr:enoyl-CoA hydratase/isomerase family protein [Gammaproteobacteria bacterium]